MADCCTNLGRAILVIINFLLLLASTAVLALGVVLKFPQEGVMEMLLGSLDELDDATRTEFHIPELSGVASLPFVDQVGVVLIALGAVLCLVSFFACCGALCQWRPLLILFVVVMAVLLLTQIIVGGMFLAEKSPIHDTVRDTLGEKVKKRFNDTDDEDDMFSFSVNLLQYKLGCCGIRGWSDYPTHKPASCCNNTIIDGDDSWDTAREQCSYDPPTAPDAFYNVQGCYSLLQYMLMSNFVVVIVVFSVALFLQLMEIVFACWIVKDINEQSKIDPL